ncbi:MAG: hypothetical protein AAF842_04015 [Planctomycetota bacterium]
MPTPRAAKPLRLLLVTLLAIGFANCVVADPITDLAREAETNPAAVRAVRDRGPTGLASVRRVYADRTDEPAVRGLIEAVAAQKDAHAAWLYWHTDLDHALERARQEGKPVLSLRLLGRLDTDLSCANSRFFRSLLYPDPEVNHRLAERFVLHWQSVRPVPVVTVDFGDGRTLRRSVVGNSVHLAIDRRGRVIDAMPGLVNAQVFAAWLDAVADNEPALPATDARAALATWHAARRDAIHLQVALATSQPGVTTPPGGTGGRNAEAADRLAPSKSIISRPMLRALGEAELARVLEQDGEAWPALAHGYAESSKLSQPARDLIRAKHPAESTHGPAASEPAAADALLAVFAGLERSIARDTARSELGLHRRLHGWYADREVDPADIDGLVRRIYDELFLAPIDDPWHGLTPDDAYAALDDGGRMISHP